MSFFFICFPFFCYLSFFFPSCGTQLSLKSCSNDTTFSSADYNRSFARSRRLVVSVRSPSLSRHDLFFVCLFLQRFYLTCLLSSPGIEVKCNLKIDLEWNFKYFYLDSQQSRELAEKCKQNVSTVMPYWDWLTLLISRVYLRKIWSYTEFLRILIQEYSLIPISINEIHLPQKYLIYACVVPMHMGNEICL